MTYFLHHQGLCESKSIGEGTRIWAFAHILPGAVIGTECNICDHVFIENDVVIGNRVSIKCGVQLWDGLRVGDDVFIGPNATFSNDHFPRSKQYPERFLPTVIEHNASIGANATILPGITIGQSAMVGAGAVVTHSVPPYAIVAGNPARIIGYDTSSAPESGLSKPFKEPNSPSPSLLRGVSLHHFPCFQDMRGTLSVGHFEREIPFPPKRYFLIFDVPSKDIRGEHAHKDCQQFLICVRGGVRVVADDGEARQEFVLDNIQKGLFLPAMTWASQFAYTADALLLVFASHDYDPGDYIRNYDEFIATAKAKKENS